MPKVLRSRIPEPVFRHLIRRARDRQIPSDQIVLLAQWLDTNPTVPNGRWFKKFSRFTVCGEGELVKTLLLPSQLPDGQELD
jgi:hypothetical protein